MKSVSPTPIKFDDDLKKAIQKYADKKYMGNFSMAVKTGMMKIIKYNPQSKTA